jgi:tRNA (guanine26-N2/guanine27-N2)-dimethyltransferase
MHNYDWLAKAIARLESVDEALRPALVPTWQRLHGCMVACHEELPDVPLFYTLPGLCSVLHCTSPPKLALHAAITNVTNPATGKPYRVSSSHRTGDAIKTDMPPELLWDIMRCWVKQNPINKKRQENENDPGTKILAKEPKIEANFTPSEALQQQIKDKTKACRHLQKRRVSGKDKLNTHGGAKVDSGEGGGAAAEEEETRKKERGCSPVGLAGFLGQVARNEKACRGIRARTTGWP